MVTDNALSRKFRHGFSVCDELNRVQNAALWYTEVGFHPKAELKSSRPGGTSTVVLCRPQERCHAGPYTQSRQQSQYNGDGDTPTAWPKQAVLITVGDKARHDES